MFVKKFMAATLSLGLTCGVSSLVYAGNDGSVCLSQARDYFCQVCKDPDLRNYYLMRAYGTDMVVLSEKEQEMRKVPDKSLREFMERLSKDPKFREDFLNILKSQGKVSKRSTWPPTWG